MTSAKSDGGKTQINSGVTGGGHGGRVPPETSGREIFADVSGKKRQGEKG